MSLDDSLQVSEENNSENFSDDILSENTLGTIQLPRESVVNQGNSNQN